MRTLKFFGMLAILAIMAIPSSPALANLCSEEEFDHHFVKVIPVSTSRVRFELCVTGTNTCSRIGASESYERSDLAAYALVLEIRAGKRDYVTRVLAANIASILPAQLGLSIGLLRGSLPGAMAGLVIGKGIGLGLAWNASCGKDCEVLAAIDRSLSREDWRCAYPGTSIMETTSNLQQILAQIDAAKDPSLKSALVRSEDGQCKSVSKVSQTPTEVPAPSAGLPAH